MAPHYCELSDFELFTYASPLSEDYQITATKVGEEIVLYINYYNSRGETIGAERILKKGVYPDWSLQKVHPDNPNIIIHSFSENAVEGETKRRDILFSRLYYDFSQPMKSFEDAMERKGVAVYYANPYID